VDQEPGHSHEFKVMGLVDTGIRNRVARRDWHAQREKILVAQYPGGSLYLRFRLLRIIWLHVRFKVLTGKGWELLPDGYLEAVKLRFSRRPCL
jgi:hypothetical protein